MTDSIIIGLVTFAAAIVGLLTPLISTLVKVNRSIVALNVTLDMLNHKNEKEHATLNTRVKEHGEEIDVLKMKAENHEVRIKSLEQ